MEASKPTARKRGGVCHIHKFGKSSNLQLGRRRSHRLAILNKKRFRRKRKGNSLDRKATFMSHSEDNHPSYNDIPPELLSIARSIMRDCRAPGTYAVTLTISPHKAQISAASITKLEQIRDISPLTRRK